MGTLYYDDFGRRMLSGDVSLRARIFKTARIMRYEYQRFAIIATFTDYETGAAMERKDTKTLMHLRHN